MLNLVTLDIPSYDLLGLTVKIPDEPLNSHILDKDFGSIYGELEKTLPYMFENQKTEKIQLAEILSCLHEGSYIFVKNGIGLIHYQYSNYVFAILLCGCHNRKLTYTTIMVMKEIPYVYKMDMSHICTMSEH